MDPIDLCPRCGAEIPNDAPPGTCPICALRLALSLGAAPALRRGADADPREAALGGDFN